MDLLSCFDDKPAFVCIHLLSERLTRELADRLEFKGVECVTDGGPYKAYGIVRVTRRLIDEVEHDPNVESVEFSEPPAGM